MPATFLFMEMDLQAFQGHLKSCTKKHVPGMLVSITCLVFFICLFTACDSKKRTMDPVPSQDSLISRTKKLLDRYNELPDSEKINSLFLDCIIRDEPYFVSDSAKKILRDAYYNRAYDYDEASNYMAAKNDFEKVLTLAQKVGYDRLRQKFITYNRVASIYNRLGDINRSLNMRKQQLELSEHENDISFLATTYINLGILYDDMGDSGEAIKLFKKGLTLDSIDEYSKGKLLSSLASVYADIGRYDSAHISANSSLGHLTAFEPEKDTLKWTADNFLTLSKIYASRNDTDNKNLFFLKAIEYRTKAESSSRVREVGKMFLTFCLPGKINVNDSGSIQRALYTVTNINSGNIFSLPTQAELYAENTIMEALDAKAEWMTKFYQKEEKLKYWQCAVDCYDLAFEVERKLLLNFLYDDSKIRMLKESRQRSEKAINLCYKLYQNTKDNQWIEKAFRFAERNKAFIILESIKRNLASSQVIQSDSSFLKVQQLQVSFALAEKSLLELRNGGDTSKLKKLETFKTEVEEQLQSARTVLYRSNDSYRQWMDKEDSISIGGATKLLPANKTILIEYFVGDSASYAIVAAPGEKYLFLSISNNHLAVIDSFQYFFRDKNNIFNNPIEYQQKANAVYIHWLKPCLDSFSGNKLLIIPDDKLNTLPFDALITKTSDESNLQAWAYLINKYEISYGYSASTLLKQTVRKDKQSGITAFAPGFMNQQRNLPPLPFTLTEVDNIKGKGKKRVFKNKEASLARFRELVPRSGIIHIASHAMSDSNSIMPSVEFSDSTLYLSELYAMHINADLVVLSACQTGIGKIEEGEGAMSLARGFYYSGVKNIVTSLWNINDDATSTLFKNFYTTTAGGRYATSLHQAKKDYLAGELSNDKYSPYYWAGFICIGADSPEINTGSRKRVILMGVAVVCLVILLFWIKRNKKRGQVFA